jgi:hypothetical protein
VDERDHLGELVVVEAGGQRLERRRRRRCRRGERGDGPLEAVETPGQRLDVGPARRRDIGAGLVGIAEHVPGAAPEHPVEGCQRLGLVTPLDALLDRPQRRQGDAPLGGGDLL